MKQNRRYVAWLVCVVLVCVMLLSCLYIPHCTDHACMGEGCTICARMEECVRNLDKLIWCAAAVFAAVSAGIWVGNGTRICEMFSRCATLVAWKKRLTI